MHIKLLPSQFRIGTHTHTMKMRRGQVALYEISSFGAGRVGFDVIIIRVIRPLAEIYPGKRERGKALWHFTAGQEVEAWTKLQELIDNELRLR